MSASVMQSELRNALDKTKTIAEEQAIRLQVLTEERSRMIQESTAQRRTMLEQTTQWEKDKQTLRTAQQTQQVAFETQLQAATAKMAQQTSQLEALTAANSTLEKQGAACQQTLEKTQHDAHRREQDLQQACTTLQQEQQLEKARSLEMQKTVDVTRQQLTAVTAQVVQLKGGTLCVMSPAEVCDGTDFFFLPLSSVSVFFCFCLEQVASERALLRSTSQLEELQLNRTKEQADVEGVMAGLRASTSVATQRLVDEACGKAVAGTNNSHV